MASVPISIRGTLYDLASKSSRQVFLEGEAYITGLGVGGGPIIPPDQGQPPGIWSPVFPSNPIPIYPGGTPNPPGFWGPNDPRPTPPIANVPGIDNPNPPDIPTEDPNWKLKAAWVPSVGWVSVIVPVGDQPVPTPSK